MLLTMTETTHECQKKKTGEVKGQLYRTDVTTDRVELIKM